MPSKTYNFTVHLSNDESDSIQIEFYCLDTSGAEWPYKTNSSIRNEFLNAKEQLKRKLAESTAKWKIVFAHHPMYTKSVIHGESGRNLRDTFVDGAEIATGSGMEQVFIQGKVDVYFTGHEHNFQHHYAKGIHHFVAGASGFNNRLLGGSDENVQIDWVDDTKTDGFLAVTLSTNSITVKFISNMDGSVIKEVFITK